MGSPSAACMGSPSAASPSHGGVSTLAHGNALFVSGAVSGVVAKTVTAPIDRVKVLMQLGAECTARRGVLVGLRAIFEAGGVRAFFQGHSAGVCKSVPEFGIKFWVNDAMKTVVCRSPAQPSAPERLACGAAAGAASCVCVYPLEVAKTRMSVAAPGVYASVAHCLVHTARLEGAPALGKGLGASLLGIMPFAAVDLTLFSLLKDRLSLARGSDVTSLELLACGAVSSSLAQLATYPLAVASTLIQASGMPGHPVAYSGLADCLLRVARADGLRGLYRGIVPNMMKAIPSVSVSYVVFENLKRRLVE